MRNSRGEGNIAFSEKKKREVRSVGRFIRLANSHIMAPANDNVLCTSQFRSEGRCRAHAFPVSGRIGLIILR